MDDSAPRKRASFATNESCLTGARGTRFASASSILSGQPCAPTCRTDLRTQQACPDAALNRGSNCKAHRAIDDPAPRGTAPLAPAKFQAWISQNDPRHIATTPRSRGTGGHDERPGTGCNRSNRSNEPTRRRVRIGRWIRCDCFRPRGKAVAPVAPGPATPADVANCMLQIIADTESCRKDITLRN